jgi:Bacterial PH domain
MEVMTGEIGVEIFRLARMSPLVLLLTAIIVALPFAFLVGALFSSPLLVVPAIFMIGICAWVWLRFRPSAFVVHDGGLRVIWPLKRREVPGREIAGVRILDRSQLKHEIGWGMRIGAGGLWGGFGWLWTKRRGLVQMYVSRIDRFVWIERAGGRPWLITPERPEAFVRALNVGREGRV